MANGKHPPQEWRMDFAILHRRNGTAAAYWAMILCGAAALSLVWFKDGPDRLSFGLVLAVWTFGLGPGVGIPIMQRVPARWFRIPRRERIFHRALGVDVFAWVLRHSGYNRRFVLPMWGFAIDRSGLRARALAARGGASAHGVCFAVHFVVAAVALWTGHPWGALWILLPGVVIHLYPVLLQRSILLRLQPLIHRYAPDAAADA